MRLQSFFVLFGFVFIVLVVFTKAQTVVKEAVIVKIQAPPQFTDELLKQGFQKAVPVYQAIDGLEYKAFSINKTADKKFFGGVYLWENKDKADKWFTPQWAEKAKQTYGSEPLVGRFAVINDSTFKVESFDSKSDKTVSILLKGLSEKAAKKHSKKSLGVYRSYQIKTADGFGVILFFVNQATADVFVKKNKVENYELFQTPVLLNNTK
jgi:hypothetical protein